MYVRTRSRFPIENQKLQFGRTSLRQEVFQPNHSCNRMQCPLFILFHFGNFCLSRCMKLSMDSSLRSVIPASAAHCGQIFTKNLSFTLRP